MYYQLNSFSSPLLFLSLLIPHLVSVSVSAQVVSTADVIAKYVNMTADATSILTTANEISPAVDLAPYLLGSGKYKDLENKINALLSKTNNFLPTLLNYGPPAGPSITADDIDMIVPRVIEFNTQINYAFSSAEAKAGIFAIAPNPVENISSACLKYLYAFAALTRFLLKDGDLIARTYGSADPAFKEIIEAIVAYSGEGVL